MSMNSCTSSEAHSTGMIMDAVGGQTLAPDGGWGWIVVIGTVITQFVVGSIARSSGVIYLQLLDRYGGSATTMSWCMAMNWVMWCALGPSSAAVMNKYGCRVATFIGATALVVGIISSGFAPNIVALYFTFGICAGVGLAFIFTPPQTIVCIYFSKKRAKAMAIATSGTALAVFSAPPLLEYLFSSYGYVGGMLLFGAIAMQIFISVALFRPLHTERQTVLSTIIENTEANGSLTATVESVIENPTYVNTSAPETKPFLPNDQAGMDLASTNVEALKYKEESRDQNVVSLSNAVSNKQAAKDTSQRSKALHWSLFRAPSFWFMCLLHFAAHMTNNGSIHLLPALKIDQGIGRVRSIWLLSVLGISDLIIRVPIGILLDLKIFSNYPKRRLLFFVSSVFLSGCVDVITPLCYNYVALSFLSVLRGVSCTVFYAQRGTVLCDLFGRNQVSSTMGFTVIPMGVGGILSRVLGGVTKDNLNSYAPTFYINGFVALVISIPYICYVSYQMVRNK